MSQVTPSTATLTTVAAFPSSRRDSHLVSQHGSSTSSSSNDLMPPRDAAATVNIPWGLMLAQDLDPHVWAHPATQQPPHATPVSHPSPWLDGYYDVSNVIPTGQHPLENADYVRVVDPLPISSYPVRYPEVPSTALGRNELPHQELHDAPPGLSEDLWSAAGHVPVSAGLPSSSHPPTDLNGMSGYPQTTRPDYLDEFNPSLLPVTVPPTDFNAGFHTSVPSVPADWSKVYYEEGFSHVRHVPSHKEYMGTAGVLAAPQIELPVLSLRQQEPRHENTPIAYRQHTFQSQKAEPGPGSTPPTPAEGCKSSESSSALVVRKPPRASPVMDAAQSKRTATFDDCITIFETVPGAIAQSKRRRKLDEASHKSFKVTRKIGACLECRFRKRTCNPGTPCQYCQKIFGQFNTAHLNCHRESPFVGFDVSDYFLLSSMKRITDFKIKPLTLEAAQPTAYITIDATSGPCSLPLKIPVYKRLTSSLSLEEQAEIMRTKRHPGSSPKNSKQLLPEYITMIAEDDESLAHTLEAWAIKYSSKFSRFYSSRYPTAYAYNVGTLYVSRRLPEHEVVQVLIRAVALSYILRAGVKVTPSSPFKTIEAKIDTILYGRVREVESRLFAMMHKLVWVSAGRLKRQQMYPVAYVIWQCMRMMCLRSSHLANLVDKAERQSHPQRLTPAYERDTERLRHCFLLLLSTHTALFRSDSPLLLDFTEHANQDLLGHDPELIDEAMRLRSVILHFKENSLSKPLKSSRWYRPVMYGRLRTVLNGRGMGE